MGSRFLVVSLIMDAVLEDATIHQRRQTLHRMANSFGLDDTYSTTLSRIGEQKKGRAKLAMEALMWISHSERPLKVEELCHALAVEVRAVELNVQRVPSIRTLLSCALGLITVDEQASTVRVIHFTLQEYLTAQPNLFITPHSLMAEICLTYLNFHSICELSTTPDTAPLATPFLRYASCHWGFHVKQEMTEGVKHLALRFLQRDANHISASILLRELALEYSLRRDGHHDRHPDLGGFTGLHCISYMGITEIAIDMVNMEKWDLNGRDCNGATPLIWAIKYGNYKLAKLLLEQEDVNPGLSDHQGLTPLTHAAKAGQEEAVRLLLDRGDVNPGLSDEDGRTPLSYAAESGHEGVVKILLEREDLYPDSPSKRGQTPLLYAAESGYEGVVKMLLERGDVDPDSSDMYGRTPLSYAAGSGYESIVRILLKRGNVNPDSSAVDGRTPLSHAAESGHEGAVKLLIERADVNPGLSDRYGRTPLSLAAGAGRNGVVRLLLEPGPFSYETSPTINLTQQSSAPTMITPEEVELFPIPRLVDATFYGEREVTQLISPPNPGSLLGLFGASPPAPPPASPPASPPTLTTAPDDPDPATSKPSGSLKRSLEPIRMSPRNKRKRLSSF